MQRDEIRTLSRIILKIKINPKWITDQNVKLLRKNKNLPEPVRNKEREKGWWKQLWSLRTRGSWTALG